MFFLFVGDINKSNCEVFIEKINNITMFFKPILYPIKFERTLIVMIVAQKSKSDVQAQFWNCA